jgi:hypothetical protein
MVTVVLLTQILVVALLVFQTLLYGVIVITTEQAVADLKVVMALKVSPLLNTQVVKEDLVAILFLL